MTTELVTTKQALLGSHFELHDNGIVINGVPTEDDYDNAFEMIKYVEDATGWWYGDLAVGRDKHYGSLKEMANTHKLNYGALREYQRVASAYEVSIRVDSLSFKHHQIAAPLDNRLDWLQKAEDNGWTTAQLKREIILAKSPPLDVEGIGDIKLIPGDMLKELPNLGKFDLIIADPPYAVTDWYWDNIPEYKVEVTKWLKVIKQAFAEQYHFFWFCSPKWATDTELVFRELDIPIKSRIVWHRRNMSMGSVAEDKFIDTWELILHSGNAPLNFPNEWNDERFDVQTFAVPQTNFTDAKVHPTQKPLDLIKWLVKYASIEGQRILDPFAGGGTTGLASRGRECVLIEKEAEYIDVIKKRLQIRE